MKQEFNVNDIAHLAKNIRGKGFTIKEKEAVKIVGCHKISNKHGGFSYDIEIENKKGNKIILERWVTQFDLYSKKMWEENQCMLKRIKELENNL